MVRCFPIGLIEVLLENGQRLVISRAPVPDNCRLVGRSRRQPVECFPIGLIGEVLLPFRPGEVAVGNPRA